MNILAIFIAARIKKTHYDIAITTTKTIRTEKIPTQTILLCLKTKTKPNKESFHLY